MMGLGNTSSKHSYLVFGEFKPNRHSIMLAEYIKNAATSVSTSTATGSAYFPECQLVRRAKSTRSPNAGSRQATHYAVIKSECLSGALYAPHCALSWIWWCYCIIYSMQPSVMMVIGLWPRRIVGRRRRETTAKFVFVTAGVVVLAPEYDQILVGGVAASWGQCVRRKQWGA